MPPRITLVHQFDQQQSETCDLTFSQDGKRLVSSDGHALYLWQLNGDGIWSYERSLPFQNAAFLRLGPDLAFCVEEGFVKLIPLDGSEGATFPCPPSRAWALSPDVRWLVSNEKGQGLLLWDLVARQSFSLPLPFLGGNRNREKPELLYEPVGRFLFTPDSQQVVLFADSPEGSLHICSFAPERRSIVLKKTLPHGMIEGVISLDGKMLAIIVPNERVYAYKQDIFVYDLESLQLLHVFPQMTEKLYCLLAFSPDSHYLMSCKDDGWVDIFSLDSRDCLAQFAAHPELSSHATDPVGGLDWSKTGYIATGGASVFEQDMKKTDYTVKLWKVEM
ncbi:MAG TPA: hypothetical protein VFV38_18560 [Ktedonobacteraceae bacterium]|nr:hypothetical protein [Ktedonobacteraceae bacterium]